MQTPTDVQTHILLKLADDPAFRERLLADPKGVIEAEVGRVLPDDTLVLVEEAVATAQQAMSSMDAPLNQDELIQVMGGGNHNPDGTCTVPDKDAWTHC